jgi:hypothetical protein
MDAQVSERDQGGLEEGEREEAELPKAPKMPQQQVVVKRRTLLVVGGKASIDWPAVFAGATLHAGLVDVTVEMASWDGTSIFFPSICLFLIFKNELIFFIFIFFAGAEIRMVSYSDCGCVVDIAPSQGGQRRSITPDFLLVRSALQGVFGQVHHSLAHHLAAPVD